MVCGRALQQDNIVPLDALVPPFKGVRPSEVRRLTSQLLFPVNVTGDRQYYLSVQAGQLLDPQVTAVSLPAWSGAACTLLALDARSAAASNSSQQ